MKKIMNKLICFFAATLCLSVVSCTDYLDKAPQSTITVEEAFKDWKSAQGFVEELYCGIPDPQKVTWYAEWNYADEFIATTTSEGMQLCAQFDLGNYWSALGISSDDQGRSWFYRTSASMGTGSARNKNVWANAWYSIRKANLGLESLDIYYHGTDEEKNLLRGQLLFFRGLCHFAIIEFWGGMPYINRTLGSNEKLDFPRLSYRETALLVAKDLEDAALLLPADWDDTTPGNDFTSGKNQQRITSTLCYAYLGKNLLFAASPLMNEESTGNAGFDADLCQKAAEAFGKVLSMVDSGEAIFNLNETFDGDTGYKNLFCSYNKKIPGNGTSKNGKAKSEVMFAPLVYSFGESRWSSVRMYTPIAAFDGEQICAPTHNYVQNFGMKNGLPLDDPASGYDATHPWKDRDPRFYTDVIYDGRQLIRATLDAATTSYAYANLSTNGNYRGSGMSRTGYMNGKWVKILGGANNRDNDWGNICMLPAFMRLADVYLMYAEAVMWGYGSPSSKSTNYTMTAVDAVNKIRNRAGVDPVADKFTGSNTAFWPELIRERAVELAFEGQRWTDLRRWKLSGERKYLDKTGINFDRVNWDARTDNVDNTDGEIANLTEFTIITRTFDKKHYWLPLPTDQVNLYEGFPQNPGW